MSVNDEQASISAVTAVGLACLFVACSVIAANQSLFLTKGLLAKVT